MKCQIIATHNEDTAISIRIQYEYTCKALRTHGYCKYETRFGQYEYNTNTSVRQQGRIMNVIREQFQHDTNAIRTHHKSNTQTMLMRY